jgi:hypothetical protein
MLISDCPRLVHITTAWYHEALSVDTGEYHMSRLESKVIPSTKVNKLDMDVV